MFLIPLLFPTAPTCDFSIFPVRQNKESPHHGWLLFFILGLFYFNVGLLIAYYVPHTHHMEQVLSDNTFLISQLKLNSIQPLPTCSGGEPNHGRSGPLDPVGKPTCTSQKGHGTLNPESETTVAQSRCLLTFYPEVLKPQNITLSLTLTSLSCISPNLGSFPLLTKTQRFHPLLPPPTPT